MTKLNLLKSTLQTLMEIIFPSLSWNQAFLKSWDFFL